MPFVYVPAGHLVPPDDPATQYYDTGHRAPMSFTLFGVLVMDPAKQ